MPFFYCSDGFLWLGFLKSEEQCLKKKINSRSGWDRGLWVVGPAVPAGRRPPSRPGLRERAQASAGGSRGPRARRPHSALSLCKKNGGSSQKVANTVGGFEVQQILNESKVFFPSHTTHQLSISVWFEACPRYTQCYGRNAFLKSK